MQRTGWGYRSLQEIRLVKQRLEFNQQSPGVHCPGKCIMHLKAFSAIIKRCLEYCVINRRMTGGDAELNKAGCC